MKLTTLAVFGAGYVVGTKAGRERYAQIVAVAEKASKRLEEYSARQQEGDDAHCDPGWEPAAR